MSLEETRTLVKFLNGNRGRVDAEHKVVREVLEYHNSGIRPKDISALEAQTNSRGVHCKPVFHEKNRRPCVESVVVCGDVFWIFHNILQVSKYSFHHKSFSKLT